MTKKLRMLQIESELPKKKPIMLAERLGLQRGDVKENRVRQLSLEPRRLKGHVEIMQLGLIHHSLQYSRMNRLVLNGPPFHLPLVRLLHLSDIHLLLLLGIRLRPRP